MGDRDGTVYPNTTRYNGKECEMGSYFIEI